jgi:hypothetical protein
MIAQDFAFRGNKAANRLQSFRDHEPGRGAAGTTRTERARPGTPGPDAKTGSAELKGIAVYGAELSAPSSKRGSGSRGAWEE